MVLLAEGGPSEASLSLRTFSASSLSSDPMYLVSKPGSVLEALQKYRPDVALLQMIVLRPDPVAAVGCLHKGAPQVALIVLAEPADNEIAAKCIQAGAIDYMLEGFLDERTLDRVLRTAINANAQQECGAPARHALGHATIGQGGERSGSARSAVRMRIEILDFRALQERNSRRAAAELPRKIGEMLRKNIRASDSVVAEGGGKFVIKLNDGVASALPAVRRRIAARLLSIRQSSELSPPLILCIDGETIPSIESGTPCVAGEGVILSEAREHDTLARQ